jgi:hypothetical protein
MSIFGLISSHSKYQLVDLTVPFAIEPWHLIVPWPKEEGRLLATIRPFQLPVIRLSCCNKRYKI